MTKTLKITGILFAAFLIFGTACNKYEDGPKLSLRTKKARMVNTWELTEYIDGDTDISANTSGTTIMLTKDGDFEVGGETKNGTVQKLVGTWEFSDDKTKLILSYDGVTIPTKWTITRLKNDELWLKREQANGTNASQKFKGLD